ncbi:hypothetical protein IAT38_001762 [Cryptococcus sp. DSM 104549]
MTTSPLPFSQKRRPPSPPHDGAAAQHPPPSPPARSSPNNTKKPNLSSSPPTSHAHVHIRSSIESATPHASALGLTGLHASEEASNAADGSCPYPPAEVDGDHPPSALITTASEYPSGPSTPPCPTRATDQQSLPITARETGNPTGFPSTPPKPLPSLLSCPPPTPSPRRSPHYISTTDSSPSHIDHLVFSKHRTAHLHPSFTWPQRASEEEDGGESTAAGTTLLATTAIFPTLNSRLMRTHCSGCMMSVEQLVQEREEAHREGEDGSGGDGSVKLVECGWCKQVVFCSTKCYVARAQDHARECRALRPTEPPFLPSTMGRLVAKCLFAKAEGKDIVPKHEPMTLKTIDEETELEELLFELMAYLERATPEFDLKSYGLKDEADLQLFARQVQMCTFNLYDHTANHVGLGISPIISKIGHCCTPNAFISFPHGPTHPGGMRVVAMRQINKDEQASLTAITLSRRRTDMLRQVTISYVDPGLPLHSRHNPITKAGFEHDECCGLCAGNQEADVRWCILHPGCLGGGLLAVLEDASEKESAPCTTKCTECGKEAAMVDMSDTQYDRLNHELSKFSKLEREGVLITCNVSQEQYVLAKALATAQRLFPSSIYPMPLLYHRLARMQASISKDDEARRLKALANFNHARDGVLRINSDQPSPKAFWIGAQELRYHLELIESYRLNFLGVAGGSPAGQGVPPVSREYGREYNAGPGRHTLWVASNMSLVETQLEVARDLVTELTEEMWELGLETSRAGSVLKALDIQLKGLERWAKPYASSA